MLSLLSYLRLTHMLLLQFGVVRKLMDELEDEMADISKEQVNS
jgi:hypothetical protein